MKRTRKNLWRNLWWNLRIAKGLKRKLAGIPAAFRDEWAF